MKHLLFLAVLATTTFVQAAQPFPLQTDEQIDQVIQSMTLKEKVDILHAWSKFSSPGVARLGIPGLWCTDGPHGIRAEVKWDEWDQAGWTSDSCTAFPALTCLAATWNPDMALQPGETASVQFVITDDMLCYYNDQTREWVLEPGQFELLVAASATDIRHKIFYTK